MKKFLVSILAFVYLTVSSGATVHLHYCMGKFVSMGLLQSKTDKCGKCAMEKTDGKNNGCCKDDYKQLKIEKDQKVTEFAVQTMLTVAVETPVSFFEPALNNFSSLTEKNPYGHAPPQSAAVAVYIRNCVFRI